MRVPVVTAALALLVTLPVLAQRPSYVFAETRDGVTLEWRAWPAPVGGGQLTQFRLSNRNAYRVAVSLSEFSWNCSTGERKGWAATRHIIAAGSNFESTSYGFAECPGPRENSAAASMTFSGSIRVFCEDPACKPEAAAGTGASAGARTGSRAPGATGTAPETPPPAAAGGATTTGGSTAPAAGDAAAGRGAPATRRATPDDLAAARADSARRAREAAQEADRIARESAERVAQAKEQTVGAVAQTGAAVGGAMFALADLYEPSSLARPSYGFEFEWTVPAGSVPVYAVERRGNRRFDETADASGIGVGAALTLWPYITANTGVAVMGGMNGGMSPSSIIGEGLTTYYQYRYGLQGHAGAPAFAGHLEYARGRRVGDFQEPGEATADETAGVGRYNLSSVGIGARIGRINDTNLLGMVRQESFQGTTLTALTYSLRFAHKAWIFGFEWSDNMPLEAGGGRRGTDIGSYYLFTIGIGGPRFFPWSGP